MKIVFIKKKNFLYLFFSIFIVLLILTCIFFMRHSPSFAVELNKSCFFNIDVETTLNDISKSDEKKAYLTFDDGPTTKATSKILDVLKEEDVKATFFVVGKHVKEKVVNATKLAIAAFIVPYVFAYSPSLLFVDVGGVFDVVLICVSALLGIYGVAAGLNGFVGKTINPLFRVLLIIGGLTLIIPGWQTDLIGLVIVGGISAYQILTAKRENNAAAA